MNFLIQQHVDKPTLHIVKIGGNILDNPEALAKFTTDFVALEGKKLLVHGGGKVVTELASQLGIVTKMVDGRRITDAASLKLVIMVYAGLINKKLVAALQSKKCNAIGLCGADGNLMQSTLRKHLNIDFGFVGDLIVQGVNAEALDTLLQGQLIPVVAPLTHDGAGQLLNTNADTIAACLAGAMSHRYKVKLSYCFEKKGVLREVEDERSVISLLTERDYINLKAETIISKGMLPKLDNAFRALHSGVEEVWIGHAEDITHNVHADSYAGTSIHI
ncbi:MAG: acetylglutamate kinase [Bacteroidia bacterium]